MDFKFKGRNWKRFTKWFLALSFLSVVLLLVVREVGVAFNKFPCELIENPPSAKIVYDRQGNIIWAETNKDKNWQIPVSLSEISPWLIQATISAEDSRFYNHSGVDNIAVVRAGLRSVMAGRLKSGASTLSMQLVKMAHLKGRSFEYKFKQMCEAISLERQRSKEWILERYLNFAPYGGNIIGIEAAARFYFRKSAKDLNLYEASLLAGLPQAPSFLRPDRFPERALKRQNYVLSRMKIEGKITDSPQERLYENFEKRSGDSRLGLAQNEEHVANMCKSYGKTSTTIDSDIQNRLRALLENHLENYSGIDSGSLVLIDNKSSEIRSVVSVGSEKVNTALSPRSSGSTLKPFIYLALMNQGSVTAISKFSDQKLELRDYDVRNFSGKFSGRVTLKKALTSSLNSPAVRALKKLGVKNFLSELKTLGIKSINRSADDYGLSLALGGAEVNLLELTNAYSCLARRGDFRPYSLQVNTETSRPIYDRGAVECLNLVLRSEELGPGTSSKIAWKTGTSNGFRDAWCIGFNDEITIGVWLGNERGEANKSLIGSVVAAPLLNKAFNELYPNGLPLPEKSKQTINKKLCSDSGLRLKGNCKNTSSAEVSRNITLGNCTTCFDNREKIELDCSKVKVLSPQPGTYKCVEKTRLELKSNLEASWFINGEYVGKGNQWYDFSKGDYRISCISKSSVKLTSIRVE